MPDRAQRVIRKIEPRRIADFDDQLWPINCAILILAGFAAGISVATGDWHAENLLYNTFFRLALVALAVGALLAAVVWLQGRMVRRVQLCVLVSLLAHLWIGLYLHQKYIVMRAAEQQFETARSILEDDPRQIVPEYHWENIERPESRHTFEEPLEVEAPKPTDPEPPKPRQVEHDVPLEKEPTATPEAPRSQQPNPAEIHRAELTAPRRAPLAAGAQISRQDWKYLPEANQPIPEPQAARRAEPLPSELAAQLAGPERRPAEAATPRREMTELAPQATRRQEEVKLARAVPPAEPIPDAPTTPTPTRQLRNPAELAQTDLKDPAAPAVERSSPTLLAMSAAEQRATAASRSAAGPLTPTRAEPAGQSLPAVGQAPRLPQSPARRSEASREEPTVVQDASSRPGTPARDASGVDLPSAVLAGPQPAAAPAAVGGSPGSTLDAVGALAVTRSPTAAPLGSPMAASGQAELAVGSGEVAARPGLPHAAGADRPSVASDPSAVKIARTEAGDGAAASLPVEPSLSAPPGTPAANEGSSPRLTANSRATTVARGGSPAAQVSRPSTGSGPTTAGSGAPDRIGAAQLARATRHESVASGVSAGGTPSPSRSGGLILAPTATVDMPQVAAAAPRDGQPGGSPLEAPTAERRQALAGLPGSLAAQARSGAVAALAPQGEPLPAAMARRAEASQTTSGGSGAGPDTSATVARSDRGLQVPSVTAAIDEPSQPGGGGVALAEGGAASRLEVGPITSVARTAGSGAIGQKATAASDAPVGIGSGSRAVLAGRVHAGREGLPSLEGTAPAASVGRATALHPMVAGNLVADLPEAAPAAAPSSDSPSDGGPGLTVQPSGTRRSTTAAAGNPSREMAQTEAAAWGPPSTTPGLTSGPRRLPSASGPGPALAAETSGGPLGKTDTAGLLRGLADTLADEPGATDPAAAEPSGEVRLAAATEEAAPTRQSGGLPVQITAKAGPGGLSYEASAQVGIPSHRARPESEVVHSVPRRFLVERSGGRLAIEGQVLEGPTEAFRQRTPGPKARSVEIYGGTEGTERAVELGLEFLVRCQFPDGHWSLSDLPEGATPTDDWALGQMRSDTAATGLALLSFFGAGYTHQSDEHRTTVRQGLEWLLERQKPNGDLYVGGSDYTWFYSHGIAAIALCEAYGMTRDPRLREPAQKAIQFIVDSQEPTRGGWRYEPRVESDTSVSGWQLMAMKSAQMAGLSVPQATLSRVSAWLDSAQSQGGTRYAYNPHAGDTPEQREGRRPNLAMTAEGALMRMYLGWPGDHPALVDVAEYLKENLPAVGTDRQPTRDAYYWYYATQVMFQMQGPYWEAWNDRLHPLLESSQAQTGPLAGSWHPLAPVRDRWGHAGGRLYVTAMNLLMLEVYYRHLPLFRTLEQ